MKCGTMAVLLAVMALTGVGQREASAQNVGSIRGTVTDPSAAVIPGATVVATGNGVARSAKTDGQGHYTLPNMPAGTYSVSASASGFVAFSKPDVSVPAGAASPLDIALQIATETQQVQVNESATAALSTDASSNASALVLKEADLDELPDDPDDLQSDLEALAGPAAGPNGAQFFIDGFSGGQLPPKSSIREIRINSNPFSSEFDAPGFGRIEILTKPGTDNIHGQAYINYGNKVFDSRNPLLTGEWPGYDLTQINANIGGPLGKKASYFFDYSRREINENALVNAQVVGPAPTFTIPTPFNQAVLTPNYRWEINPRLDYQLNSSNTLVVRYNHIQTSSEGGLGGFALPTQETLTAGRNNQVQITETAVLGTVAVDETRFQFRDNHTNINATGDTTIPGIDVASSFNSGGAPFTIPNYTDTKGYELTNVVTLSKGKHAVKVGARLRQTDEGSSSSTNFNGSWLFQKPSALATGPGGCLESYGANPTSLDLYQQTQILLYEGVPIANIVAQGCGPNQFTLSGGIAVQGVRQFDLGAFVQDDWRILPNLTVNLGVRYETQNNISDHNDWAPRVGIAWAPGAKGKTASKTVIRAGYGIFYSRFAEANTLNALRFNGVEQTNYSTTNPLAMVFYPELPPTTLLTSLNQAIYTVDSNMKSPYLSQAAISVDRQLPGRTQVSVQYVNTRGVHVLRQRDINAPNSAGVRPFAGTDVPNADGDIYQYEDSGLFKQSQFTVNANSRLNSHLQLQGYYSYSQANTNVSSTAGFPMDQYDTSLDWGRAPYDIHNRGFIGGTVGLPLRLQLNPFVTMQSGAPFNITTGGEYDGQNDQLLNGRPSFAQCVAAQNIVISRFGCFNTQPAAGAALIPVNYGDGPAQFSVNLRLSRTWGWGERKGAAPTGRQGGGGPGGGGPGGGGFPGGGGGGPRGGFGGGGGGRGGGGFGGLGGGNTGKRYNLTATVSARNAFNHVNLAQPIGNLSSLSFGESTQINNGNSAAGNRKIEFQLRFQF